MTQVVCCFRSSGLFVILTYHRSGLRRLCYCHKCSQSQGDRKEGRTDSLSETLLIPRRPKRDALQRYDDQESWWGAFCGRSQRFHCSLFVQVIRHAVSGMLPKNKLRERRLERLKIFPSFNMGVLGGNVLRSWDDGTLPPNWNPRLPTTSDTLKQNWRFPQEK